MPRAKTASKPHPLDDILFGSTTPTPTRSKARVRAAGTAPATEPPAKPTAREEEPAVSATEPPAKPTALATEPPAKPTAREEDPALAVEAPEVEADSWNATHERVTFHCPVALRDRIYAEVQERKRLLSPRERRAFGRTRVIVEILARHYGVKLQS